MPDGKRFYWIDHEAPCPYHYLGQSVALKQMTITMKLTKHLLLIILLGSLTLNAQVADPVPDIQASDLTYTLEDFVTIPKSNNTTPRARINMLRELPDSSGRMFVNDLNGPGHIIDGETIHEYLDMKDVFPRFITSPGKGTGFGGVAFHPDFATNGLLYTSHTEWDGGGPTVDFSPEHHNGIALEGVITEWTATDPTANTFAGTRREVMRFSFPHSIHDLQDILFNPLATPDSSDYGNLYICVGEGGTMQWGFANNLQNPNTYMGTIFRVDPLGTNGRNGQYGVPTDNPFVGDSSLGLPEVWVSGFRNPHRLSWDLGGDHKALIGDIGELSIEEVNLVVPGGNYGWSEREGTFEFRGQNDRGRVYPLPANDSGYVYPVAQFDHEDGLAVICGFVYRGQALPELYGEFICGDIPGGRIFHAPIDSLIQGRQFPLKELQLVDANGNPTSLYRIVPGSRVDLRFGQTNDGEIFILTKADGKIRYLAHPQATSVRDRDMAETGTWVPNPTLGVIHFQANGVNTQGMEVDVVGLNGQLYMQEKGTELDLSALATGIYVLQWKNEAGQIGRQAIRKE